MAELPLRSLQSRIKLRQLQLLKAAGHHLNLHRAADDLGISQPAATVLLRDVEAVLGVQVFERGRQGLQPTLHTHAVLRWASATLARLHSAQEDIAAKPPGVSAMLRIGSVYSAVPRLLSAAIALIGQRQPDILLTVKTGIASNMLPELRAGQLDCVIAHLAPDVMLPDLEYRVLFQEMVDFVVGPQHPLATHFLPERLGDFDWILPMSRGDIYDQIARKLISSGLGLPQIAVETWSPMVVMNLLGQADYITILPRSMSTAYGRYNLFKVLPLNWSPLYFPLGIITHASEPPSQAFNQVIAALEEMAQSFGRSRPDAETPL